MGKNAVKDPDLQIQEYTLIQAVHLLTAKRDRTLVFVIAAPFRSSSQSHGEFTSFISNVELMLHAITLSNLFLTLPQTLLMAKKSDLTRTTQLLKEL